MKNIKTLIVKFSNKKNNKCAKFVGHFGVVGENLQGDSLVQTGDFRSDFAWNQYSDKKQFVTAIERYLNNPNAQIERLEVDNAVAGSFGNNEYAVLKIALDSIKG